MVERVKPIVSSPVKFDNHISREDYLSMYKESIEDNQGFWKKTG